MWSANYKIIEKSLIVLVGLMSISFIFAAITTGPSFLEIFSGLFALKTPEGSLLTIIGLVGTTIVPYNLLLHAELVKEKWSHPGDLKYAMKDMIVALSLGGIISMSVIITAAGVESTYINSVEDLALGLEPVFGNFSKYFLAVGLFSAGITSTITAPLAAAYIVCSCFGWKTDLKSKKFKIIWFLVILFGVFFSTFSLQPILIIQFAQIINGILLPIIAILLLWIVNNSKLLGVFKNNKFQNLFASVVVLLSIFISLRTIILIL